MEPPSEEAASVVTLRAALAEDALELDLPVGTLHIIHTPTAQPLEVGLVHSCIDGDAFLLLWPDFLGRANELL